MTDVAHTLIHLWIKERVTISEIAKNLNLSRGAVRYNIGKPLPSLRLLNRVPPVLPTAKQRRIEKRRKVIAAIVMEETTIKKNGYVIHKRTFNSSTTIRCELIHRCPHLCVCINTIHSDLKAIGAVCRKRPKGPMMREGDDLKRKEFCQNLGFKASSILFSDEKYFDCQDHGQEFQWCVNGELPHRRSIERFSPKVHVWGMIGVGVKVLVILNSEMINSDNYISQCLRPNLATLTSGVFMQDGARAHTANATISYLEKSKVTILKSWPPRSPELNPIENLWSVLQRRVSDMTPTCEEDVRVCVQRAWRSIPQSEIDSLVLSFDRRVASCLANGGSTSQLNFGGGAGAQTETA